MAAFQSLEKGQINDEIKKNSSGKKEKREEGRGFAFSSLIPSSPLNIVFFPHNLFFPSPETETPTALARNWRNLVAFWV